MNSIYLYQVNKAIDFIRINFRNQISIKDISNVTCFSPFHFHRIFKAITNENVNDFVKREKMEFAIRTLIYDKNSVIKNIAYDLGYNSAANFSRDFKSYYGFSPNFVSKNSYRPFPRVYNQSNTYKLEFLQIEQLKQLDYYYYRINGYSHEKIVTQFEKLTALIHTQKLNKQILFYIGIAHHDPEVTSLESCIYDAGVCLKLNNEIENLENLNHSKIVSNNYAVFSFEGNLQELHNAWDEIYEKWLCESDLMPANTPNLEMFVAHENSKSNEFSIYLYVAINKK